MLDFEVGAEELLKRAAAEYAVSADEAGEKVLLRKADMTGFVDLPDALSDELIDIIEAAAREIRAICDTLVVIGIGGSYLGVAACDRIFKKDGQPLELRYAGCNLSASYHRHLFEELEGREPALCVISKSGTTMESAMAFSLLREYMERRYGKESARRITVITGAHENPLRSEGREKGYRIFTLPHDVGGRYSVLSVAGLLPLAAAGYDIRKLLAGAGRMKERALAEPFSKTPCGKYAMIRNYLYREGKRVEVFSLTEDEMHETGSWLAQLFGESEGKNSLGFFPACVHYSTDLHAVGQFLEDGSRVFFETLLTVKDHGGDVKAPGFCHSYNETIQAASEAVWNVRKAKGTPVVRITLDDMSEESIGEMLYFFETACAAGGFMMGLDPFDQPGVEAYKRELRTILGK